MQARTLLLSGPPASGKDSLSQCLTHLACRYVFAEKFKDSTDGSSNHRIVTSAVFDSMVRDGEFLQWHARYGRRYGLARATLENAWASGQWPIVHVGRLANLLALQPQVENPISILLRCRKDILLARLAARHPGDIEEQTRRMEAAGEEIAETRRNAGRFDIVFDNDFSDPGEAAIALHQRISRFAGGDHHG